MKKIKIYSCIICVSFFVSICLAQNNNDVNVEVLKRPDISNKNDYYVGNKAPLLPLSFTKLPIGSIQPNGWLQESLLRAKDGMTGRLEEVSEWLQKEDNAWLSPTGEGIHGWEEVPYWLKGYGDLAYILNDSSMINEAKFWIEGVLGSQREDGYFGPESSRHDGKPDLWPNMVMLWCLQSYYDFSHDKRIIPFMKKYFQWEMQLPDSSFLEDYWGNSRGGDNLYSVYWLYNRTGEEWLLDLAKKIHKNTADWKQEGNLPNWHNVNIAQGFREPAIYYMQTNDSTDMKAAYDNFDLIRRLYGQVPGGMFGADENAREGFTGPEQGIETCGLVEQMNSDEILLQITGDPFWADHSEETAFNTYTAALMPDFKSLRYFTAPNMVTSDAKNHHPGIDNTGPFFMMNPLSNRCCQHNHTQGWPYFAENLWMATPDNGLAAVLYSASSVTAKVGADGTEVTITEDSHYPFSNDLEFSIDLKNEGTSFPLYLRVPEWSNGPSIYVNGDKQTVESDLEGRYYVRLEKRWKNGDRIRLSLPQEIEIKRWPREGISVKYGPLTYSLKIKEDIAKADPKETALHDSKWREDVDVDEWPAYTIKPNSDWNFGLLLKGKELKKAKVVHKEWPKDNYPFTPENVPVEIEVKGKSIPGWTIGNHGLVGDLPLGPVKTNTKTQSITLIPMGAARLRISTFPIVR